MTGLNHYVIRGGDMTTVLARRVGPSGSVLGIDLDAEKLDLCRREAAELGLRNVDFQLADLRDWRPPDLLDDSAKRIHLLTLENIADALIQRSVASREEVEHLLQELETRAADRTVVAALPRVVQTWGRRPAS